MSICIATFFHGTDARCPAISDNFGDPAVYYSNSNDIPRPMCRRVARESGGAGNDVASMFDEGPDVTVGDPLGRDKRQWQSIFEPQCCFCNNCCNCL